MAIQPILLVSRNGYRETTRRKKRQDDANCRRQCRRAGKRRPRSHRSATASVIPCRRVVCDMDNVQTPPDEKTRVTTTKVLVKNQGQELAKLRKTWRSTFRTNAHQNCTRMPELLRAPRCTRDILTYRLSSQDFPIANPLPLPIKKSSISNSIPRKDEQAKRANRRLTANA